ncbi:hypothetical protein VTN31DRAFT_7384 [Thermomyces dupontii]|uniref:uncharacterized protein n=1 Tax=Talaromyces thermophilus TaxID=28565 RepID=UPI0037436BC1
MVESWSAESPELSKITLPTETPTRHLFFCWVSLLQHLNSARLKRYVLSTGPSPIEASWAKANPPTRRRTAAWLTVNHRPTTTLSWGLNATPQRKKSKRHIGEKRWNCTQTETMATWKRPRANLLKSKAHTKSYPIRRSEHGTTHIVMRSTRRTDQHSPKARRRIPFA